MLKGANLPARPNVLFLFKKSGTHPNYLLPSITCYPLTVSDVKCCLTDKIVIPRVILTKGTHKLSCDELTWGAALASVDIDAFFDDTL